ncbi:stimulated by retinoic acid gene 6 protein-like [Aplysia californica]|uniref:Stimulated by retinoic acid gene 6 protein-like n=1 Tax=Aplysia californica TaxID=6500 RepID=A0ABM1A1D0_APLCA|nr:stimulated by retinoic acid gene 6 protein-like [Aplysia californica]
MEDILESTPGKRVRILLTPSWRLEKKPEASSRLRKVLTLVQELTYRWEPDFKYSARLLSTLMVGLMVLYAISFQAIVLGITSFKYLKKYADVQVNKKIELATTDAQRAEYRAQRETWETMVDYFVGPVIASQCLASLLGLYGILRMLTGYRTTMYRLYRGEMKEFTQGNSNTAILVSCLKYSGFQVAYIAWGYIIHMVFFLFICGVLSLVIALLSAGFTDWFVHDFLGLWPIPLWAVITYLVQYLLAKFFFLQDRGDYLAFDNRRSLFLFSYFMFFYNIFLGLFSTVLRLIKGMVIGAVMLPRLDHSTLPMSFAGSDPGYNAYVGFMQVECSQSHPVMVTFIRLLMLLARKREAENRKWAEKESEFRGRRPLPRPHSRGKSQKQRAAAFNWHVTYTLINNPDLRMERKGYIQTMKKARELGVRIPKSDGFVVLDPELLREAELEQKRAAEGVMSHVEDKLVAFRLMLRKKVQNGIETVTKKSSRSGSIERLNDIEMESVEEGRRGRGGGGLRSVDI